MPPSATIHLRSTATAANNKRQHSDANDIDGTTIKKPRIDNGEDVDKALKDHRAAINERSEEDAKLRARQADELGQLQAKHDEQTDSLQAKQIQGMSSLEEAHDKQMFDLLSSQHRRMVSRHKDFAVSQMTNRSGSRRMLDWRAEDNEQVRELTNVQEKEKEVRQSKEHMADLLTAQCQEMNSVYDEHQEALSKLQVTQAQRVLTTKAALDCALGKVSQLDQSPSVIKIEDLEELHSTPVARVQQANAPAMLLRDDAEQGDQVVDDPVFKHNVDRLVSTSDGQVTDAELLRQIGKLYKLL